MKIKDTAMRNNLLVILIITTLVPVLYSAEIKKDISFQRYSLEDRYTYKDDLRIFQWGQISSVIDSVIVFKERNTHFGIFKNYKNRRGVPPLTSGYLMNSRNIYTDSYGTYRYQGIPLYTLDDSVLPKRYSFEGSLVALIAKEDDFYIVEHAFLKGVWRVPKRYVDPIRTKEFNKIIFIDNTNQNITLLENVSSVWYVKSMNPATTGKFEPPYKRGTPRGVFVLLNKKFKMLFLRDGTDEIGGYAPYASRFSGGAYIHGVPNNYHNDVVGEYSETLGTVPLSHMCVRNATSHAKFVYEWGVENETLIIVIE